MAKKGSVKYFSVQHEDHIAKLFHGERSPSSGAAEHDGGDVRSDYILIECKMTGNPGAAASKPLPKFVREFEKIAKEAWEEGRTPMLALRYWSPDSVLAGPNGWVDLTLLLATDMADREERFN